MKGLYVHYFNLLSYRIKFRWSAQPRLYTERNNINCRSFSIGWLSITVRKQP